MYKIEELQPLKYNVGDNVLIATNFPTGILYDDDGKAFTFVTETMRLYQGKLSRIVKISNNPINRGYYLLIDKQLFVWHEKLLTKLGQNKYRIK